MTEGRTSIRSTGGGAYVRPAELSPNTRMSGLLRRILRRPRGCGPLRFCEAILTKYSIFRNIICYFSRQTNGIIHIGFLYAASTFKKEA